MKKKDLNKKILEEMTQFDLSKEYKNEVEPLMRQLALTCYKLKMPMFVTVCTKNIEDKKGNPMSFYESDAVRTDSNDIILAEDHIVHHIGVNNGFKTIPPEIMKMKISEEDLSYIEGQ